MIVRDTQNHPGVEFTDGEPDAPAWAHWAGAAALVVLLAAALAGIYRLAVALAALLSAAKWALGRLPEDLPACPVTRGGLLWAALVLLGLALLMHLAAQATVEQACRRAREER